MAGMRPTSNHRGPCAVPMLKRIICLANSRKRGGRCVAGVELVDEEPAGWIRPISAHDHEAVPSEEREYENGGDPQILDVIDVPVLKPVPSAFQTENWRLDPKYYWAKVGQLEPTDLADMVDDDGPLWLNTSSTIAGLNDRVPATTANGLTSSLRLVHVPAMQLSVFKPGADYGNFKRRVQARFELGGDEYRLWVTDSDYEPRFKAHDDGDYDLGPSYLTISLAKPDDDGYAYKLVAAIIEGPR
jgi:hypothetical protein